MPEAASVPYGILGEFNRPEAIVAAARAAHAQGYRAQAYTPFPVEGLDEALGLTENRVPWCGLAGGLFGAASGYLLQIYIGYDYPIDVGGRGLIPIPAFTVVSFELTILFAVAFGVFGMLILDRLPRLYHPLFNIDRFTLASRDRFFLCLENHGGLDIAAGRAFFERFKPVSIREVPR